MISSVLLSEDCSQMQQNTAALIIPKETLIMLDITEKPWQHAERQSAHGNNLTHCLTT